MEINSSADFVRMTRGALAAAGFVRQEKEGTVWWTSPAQEGSSGVPTALSVIPSVSEGPGWVGREERASRPARPGPSLDARDDRELSVPRVQRSRFDNDRDDRSTIVLLHGANDHAGTWFTVAPALAQRYRVILPDLAGHGESAPRSGPIPISLVVDRLDAVIAGERDITLLGNSLGGWIALLYTLRHPGRVARLVLEASGGLARPLSSPFVARTRDEASTILRAVHGPRFEAPEWVIEALLQRADDSPMLRLTEALEHNIEPRLGEIRTPATLIWGADDGVLPLSYAHALQQAISGSTLHVIEGAAHIPHLQQPRRFLECLTAIF